MRSIMCLICTFNMYRDTKREIRCSRKNPAFSGLSIREANRKRGREKTKTATTKTTRNKKILVRRLYSLRTADVFPVVASLPSVFLGG